MTPILVPEDMSAVVWEGKDRTALRSLPTPALEEDHALVQVRAAGICATDLEIVGGEIPSARIGVIPGHEIAGIVVRSIGRNALSIGTRVVVDTVTSCGHCESCQSGDDTACSDAGELGFTANGGWAEYVTVANRRLYELPPTLSLSDAAAIEPFVIPFGSLNECSAVVKGRDVGVVGSGIAAMGFVRAAAILGARNIHVAIRHPARITQFRRMAENIQFHLTPPETAVADVTVDAVGSDTSLQTAISMVRDSGTTVAYGLSKPTVDRFPLADIVLRNITLEGHTNPRDSWATFLESVHKDSGFLVGIVDQQIGLKDVPQYLSHWPRTLKTVICF